MTIETRPARTARRVLAAGLLALMVPAAASAADEPSADEIADAVSDHTFQGSMSKADSTFAEYYSSDGSIRADGYSGKWRTEDGAMCFQYGSDPERCFQVKLRGPSMEMYNDGKLDGNGMLIDGNPSDF